MKLEELLQRVEAANPWTAEKISKALGAEFEYSTSQNGDFSHYDDDRGPDYLRYEENLFLKETLQNPSCHSARSEAKSQNPDAAWILRLRAG